MAESVEGVVSVIEQVIPVRRVPLIDSVTVNRALPFRRRRMVGPFIFFDHLGPMTATPESPSLDVAPHPHIGIATLTYVLEGEIMHRDSLGSVQLIRPREVNIMTAGKGIVHSERVPDHLKYTTHNEHAFQAWIALPIASEQMDPTFQHIFETDVPQFEIGGAKLSILVGEAFGRKSPAIVQSKMFYLHVSMPKGSTFEFDTEGQEAGLYLVNGDIGITDQNYKALSMIVFTRGSKFTINANEDSEAMLLGGMPLEGTREIWWNFVASSPDLIEKAKSDWKALRFPMIPGESGFIPLPEK